MDHVGIDLGTYSTFACSSRDRGTMLEDEMNEKAIRTVVDLLTPRLFGNSIRVDNRRSIRVRKRDFPLLRSGEDYKHVFMFLAYLKRLMGLKSASFAVPYWYTDVHKRRLADMASLLGMSVENIVRDVSAHSLCLVKQENIPQSLCILDFGHSKTTAGHFVFRDNVLRVERVDGIMVGSRNMDEKLVAHFVKENGVEDGEYYRELIADKIGRLKTILNSTDSVSLQVDEEVTLAITRETYEAVICEDIREIKAFVEQQMGLLGEGTVIEVVGGNSNSYVVRALLPENVGRSLNPSESVAVGCSLLSLVGRSKVTFRDLSSTYLIKLKDSAVKPSVIFSSSEVPSDSIKVTYKKKKDFTIEVFEDELQIGEVDVCLSSEEPVPVTISFCMGRRGVLEISEANKAAQCKISVRMKSFDDEELTAIRGCEEELRSREVEIEGVRQKRAAFEEAMMNLNQNLRRFGDDFVEDRELVDTVAGDLMHHPSSNSLAEEDEVHSAFLSRLRPVTDKLNALDLRIKDDVRSIKDRIRDVTMKYSRFYTPGLYQLRGELFMIEKWEGSFKLCIETMVDCNLDAAEGFKSRIDMLIRKAEAEASEKIKEEEAEKTRKAEEEAKEPAPEAENLKNEVGEAAPGA